MGTADVTLMIVLLRRKVGKRMKSDLKVDAVILMVVIG